ncbi:MAG: hypothetical protein ABI947_16450 [Chloroflexota bacterium]
MAQKKKLPKPKFGELGLNNWLKDPTLFRTDFPRIDNLDLREHYHDHFLRMKQRKDFKKIVEALRVYLQECIPAPRLTEHEWWCVTSMPSTNKNTRISAVNIHWMEIFVLGFFKDNPDEIWGFINVDGDTLSNIYATETDLWKKHPYIDIKYPNYERSAGTAHVNTVHLRVDGIEDVLSMLKDSAILDAARSLNYEVMSLERTVYGRYHCYDLADLLL